MTSRRRSTEEGKAAGRNRSGRVDAQLVREWLVAAEAGDLSTVKRLLAAEPRLLDASGQGPYWKGNVRALHYAVHRNHRRVVGWLLAQGASAGPVDGDADWAPIHFAAVAGHRNLVHPLIQHGARMDIFAAAALGDARAVRRLLGEDPTVVAGRGPDGATALHLAASPDVAKLLLAAGADPGSRDTFHRGTPIQWAVDRPRVAAVLAEATGAVVDIHLACAMGDLRRVRALVARNPEAVNKKIGSKRKPIGIKGETPLGVAARYGQRNAVGFLLQHDAVAATDPSPLPDAVRKGDPIIVKRLLKAGADPNAFCPHGHAALHMAASRGDVAMIRLLLSSGARLDLKDKEHDSTPLGWAAYHEHKQAFDFLKAHGGV
ncbi:MAG: ankyrin repeat domain-containing protein [Vicinamibacterales bacterium]